MKVNFFGLSAELVSQSRMMQCDGCHALTNHDQDESGDLVCAVCGHNATQALRADEHTLEALGRFVGYLNVAVHDGCLDKWLAIFVDTLAEEVGEDAVRLLGDTVGRRRL